MDSSDKQQPQFSYEEIPGRNQGVIYCHWPIAFKAYFFIRDMELGRFLLLPEHRNDKTAKLMETMKGWFALSYKGFTNKDENSEARSGMFLPL